MGSGLLVRVNGVMPAKSAGGACTSCSIIEAGGAESSAFHILVDAGPGVSDSLNQAASELKLRKPYPDAILVTHAHKEQYEDLEKIASSADSSLKIYCTKECADKIVKDLPSLSSRFSYVVPLTEFTSGPFSIVPLEADHSGDQGGPAGSVIYVIRYEDKKVICAWDFLSLPSADAKLVWNPDLLVIGTETYNDHPSTGLISVSEAYNLVRRWNAKDTFIVRYSGEKDSEDARNQWFRGPTRPLSFDELQKVIDEHLGVSGAEGKYSISVARQGTIWRPRQLVDVAEEPVGDSIEIEAIEKYVLKLNKRDNGTLVLTIEDAINRQEAEFSTTRVSEEGKRLDAEPIKGFMMKGPSLSLTISPHGDEAAVRVDLVKGKKSVISDNLRVSLRDAQRLIRYLNHNFGSNQKVTASV